MKSENPTPHSELVARAKEYLTTVSFQTSRGASLVKQLADAIEAAEQQLDDYCYELDQLRSQLAEQKEKR